MSGIATPPFIPSFGAGVPGAAVPVNQLYYDTTTIPYTPYVFSGGAWHKFGAGTATGANPTATAGPAAVNGVAPTYMRSDGAPAIQLGSNAAPGLAQGDGTSITIVAGIASTIAGSSAKNTWAAAHGITTWSTNSTVNAATHGNGFVPMINFTVDRLYVGMANATSGHVYQAAICTVDPGTLAITAIQLADTALTAGANGVLTIGPFTWATPFSCVAGTLYIIAFTDTNLATGATALPIQQTTSAAVPGYVNLPLDPTLQNLHGGQYSLASLAPAVTNVFVSRSLSDAANLMFRAQIT